MFVCVQLSSSEQLQQNIFLLNQQLVLLRETNRGLREQLEGGATERRQVRGDTYTHRVPQGERGRTEEPDSGHMICFFHEVLTVVQLI